MLRKRLLQRGFNLIEVLVTLTVLGVLIALGAPSLAEFLQNQQIRAATEAIVNGLQIARGEAIKRNVAVQLVLEPPTSGWTICEANIPIACDSTTLAADATLVIQSRSPAEGTSSANVTPVAADLTPAIRVTYSPLGSALPTNPVDASTPLARVDVFKPGSACIADGGPMRCLRVVVTPGGSIRMCDPTPGIAMPDPRACP